MNTLKIEDYDALEFDALGAHYDDLGPSERENVASWYSERYALHFGQNPEASKFERVMMALAMPVIYGEPEPGAEGIGLPAADAATLIDHLATVYVTAQALELTP